MCHRERAPPVPALVPSAAKPENERVSEQYPYPVGSAPRAISPLPSASLLKFAVKPGRSFSNSWKPTLRMCGIHFQEFEKLLPGFTANFNSEVVK